MRLFLAILFVAGVGVAGAANAKSSSIPKGPLSQSRCVKLGGTVLPSTDCPTKLCCHIYKDGQLAADLCVK